MAPRVPRVGSEPANARSPLNLRLALAVLGLVLCAGGAVAFLVAGQRVPAAILGVGALAAVVDIVVVQVRRVQRRRWEAGHGGAREHSLFE
jgi:hypothetical protein